jgi:hypothetical protein
MGLRLSVTRETPTVSYARKKGQLCAEGDDHRHLLCTYYQPFRGLATYLLVRRMPGTDHRHVNAGTLLP